MLNAAAQSSEARVLTLLSEHGGGGGGGGCGGCSDMQCWCKNTRHKVAL